MRNVWLMRFFYDNCKYCVLILRIASQIVKVILKPFEWPKVIRKKGSPAMHPKPCSYMIEAIIMYMSQYGVPRLCPTPSRDKRPYVVSSNTCYLFPFVTVTGQLEASKSCWVTTSSHYDHIRSYGRGWKFSDLLSFPTKSGPYRKSVVISEK